MMNIIDLAVNTITQGLIYALLSYAVYITYKILDFPDLTVDGSFPLGAAITAVLLTNNVNPYLTLLVALAFGAIAGLVTGFIHVRLHIRALLAGIITMTGLFSINLQIAGSNLIVDRSINTIFTSGIFNLLFGNIPLIYRKLVITLIIALVFKLMLDLYFKTKNGLLLRAVGDNDLVVTMLAKDKGTVKIIGLTIANALVALSGSIVCQEQRSFSSTMGTGQVVFGLATVIMGTTIFRRFGFVKGTTAVLAGSIVYKACIQVALTLGLPANLLKFVTSILFLVILVYGNYQQKTTKAVSKNARA